MGLLLVLVRINSAIQISIVNQRYSSTQALFLAFNSAFYPELSLQDIFAPLGMNQLVMGVSAQAAPAEGGSLTVVAMTQSVGRTPQVIGNNDDQAEPNSRSLVRVRNTVTLCIPSVFVLSQGKPVPILSGGGKVPTLGGAPLNLSEGSSFNSLCASPLNYL